ncbi:effector-associated domain EAD1-containing protein [Tardiphaga sp. 803_E3_N1_3]|uniref:GAP1-N1 domain-containing protein n=1 Tax=Tardiphaga sp. 803_E3_N1_3 TaxID=3240785 RepID=UPI003F253AE9
MLVDQAIYGAVRNGHGLKCASGDPKLAAELAHRLDLPDTAPPGAEWSPFVSGFAIRDLYVVTKTFSDTSASRAGMVLTHALICRLDEIVELNDLRALFERLVTSPDKAPGEVFRLDITTDGAAPPPTPDLANIAQALVARGKGPVVWVGIGGFEQVVAALWGQLWPSMRRRFSFRLSFGPKDIVEQPEPALICTPSTLIGRWQQVRIVGKGSDQTSHAATMIDGSEAGSELRRFAAGIGASLDTFDLLRLVEQAYLLATGKPDTMERLVSVVRLVQHISPDSNKGEKEKRVIVERLTAALRGARPQEILTLRNLSVSGFATGDLIWQEIERWFEQSNYPAEADGDLVQAVIDAIVLEEAQLNWRDAAKRGLERSSREVSGDFPSAFWRWSAVDTRISTALITLLRSDRAVLERIVEAAPRKLALAAAQPVLAVAIRMALYSLHAVTASASMLPAAAAKAQSAIEPGDDVSSMRLALRGALPRQLLDIAYQVDDARVRWLAVEAASRAPDLFAGQDMSTNVNRAIWQDAIKINSDAWRGPTNPQAVFERLLDEQIDGQHPPAELIRLLAATPLADVTSFVRRRELWRHLDADVRERLLAATVDKWFANPDAEIEQELLERVAKDRRLDTLFSQLARGDFAIGLRFVSILTSNDNSRLRSWVGAAVGARTLSDGDANLLGQSIAARGRRDIVSDLTSMRWGGRRDLDPVLRHCTSLMGIVDRIWLGISPVTDTEKREALIELAGELYPTGPDHDGLWERAGGKNSDLTHHGSGIGRWRDALRAIQNGKKPPISKLIQQMRNDFGANPKLRAMADDPLFRK